MTDFAIEPADQYLTRQELIALTGWTHNFKQQRNHTTKENHHATTATPAHCR